MHFAIEFARGKDNKRGIRAAASEASLGGGIFHVA